MKNGLQYLPQFASGEFINQEQDPTFAETLGASLAYKYDPLIDKIEEDMTFNNLPDAGYRAVDHIPEDMLEYSSTLVRATNQQHMNFLIGNIRDGLETRKTLYKSGLGATLAAEIVDPINWLAIPFTGGQTITAAGLRAGAGTAAIVAGQEAIRYPVDPLATVAEVGVNIGSAFALGGLIGGLVKIPAARRAKAYQNAQEEINRLQEAITPVDGEPLAEIAPSLFTDSWLYKSVPTPLKNVLIDKEIPNSAKLRTLKIANDSGILLAANKQGQKVGNSVFQNAKLHEGDFAKLYDDLSNAWGESSGRGVVSAMDYWPARKDFNKWINEVDSKAMRGIEPADEFEAAAIEKINSFYANWETRLRETGLIGTEAHYKKVIARNEEKIKSLQDRLAKPLSAEIRGDLQATLVRLSDEIDRANEVIEVFKDKTVMPSNEKVFRPRYWNQAAIRSNREGLEAILREWFSENPLKIVSADGRLTPSTASTEPAAIALRAKESVDTILGLSDVTDFDVASFGAGKSKHFKHRLLDIPNEKVLDFIYTDTMDVMKAYIHKTAPRYEFAKMFEGKSIDDVLEETYEEIISAGGSREKAHETMKNMRHLYERVTRTVLRNPESWDQKTAKVMRDLAQLNYLGSAGFSTLTEPARIIMEHGLGTTIRGLFSVLKSNQLKLGAREGRIAGEALENLMGSAQARIVDEVNNNPMAADLFDKLKRPFYLLNGLAPITRILKDFDAMLRSHSIIDYSVRWTKGQATQQEQEYLLRYNINFEDAQKIANAPWQKSESGMYMANTDAWTNTIEFPATKAEVISGPTNSYAANGRYKPAFYRHEEKKIYIDEEYIKDVMWNERGWENPRVEGVRPIEDGIINTPDDLVTFIKMHEIMHSLNRPKDVGIDMRKKGSKAAYENAINDLAIAEIKKQERVAPETVQTFRNALSSGIMNTILMGTPADKPIITDGIVYVPMRVAKQFGMKEDAKYKGYARIENGLLGLPFQFYSYALAAVNKTTAAYGHGQLKNQFVGTAISLGLGYLVLQYKTPDFVKMSFQDQLARSFDYSGVAALYSDMFYTAMSTSLALGGPNLTGGGLQPRFPQEKDYIDAATGVLGAGPSIASDISRGAYDLATGNIGEGSKEVIRNLPMARLWFWKQKMNEFTRMLEKGIDEPSGFGRY